MATDLEIIEAVLAGAQDRYAELVDRYQPQAITVAYGFVGNYEDARELSQNGFVKAYEHLVEFRGHSKFSTWFYRIVVNECKDFLKAKSRRPSTVSLSPAEPDEEGDSGGFFELEDPGSGPSQQLANRELGAQLTQAIGDLPMQQRTAFMLHHVQGMSLEEVAQIMGCRIGTIKAHIFRATEHLRARLKNAPPTE